MRKGFVAVVVCGVVVVTAAAGVDGLLGGPNVIANPGFESTLAAAPACSTPVITGNWRAVSCAATQLAERVATPVHAGGFSGHVRTLARNGGQAYFYQDVPGFGVNDSFELSTWVLPVAGPQQVSMLFGWDRVTGATVGHAVIGLSESRIEYGAWGVFHTGPSISYNEWHHLRLVGDVTTGMQQLFIDGVPQAAVPMGTPKIALSVTLLVGQGTGVNTPASEFYFDDANVARLTQTPADVTQCFADLAAANATIAARDERIDELNAMVAERDGRIAERDQTIAGLDADLAASQAAAAELARQLAAAAARISDLESRLARSVSDADLQAIIAVLTADLRSEFRDPGFVIPGDTSLAQLQNVADVLMHLEHGRKRGVFLGLRGR